MGKSLIITEKPSVARDFARVLGVSGRGDGYIENEQYVISWCVGHLVGMVYPESYDERLKKWRLEDLPFLPKEYKYDVIKNVAKQYEIVHGLLFREDIDTVYWAGDAGKEGQTIEENIRNFGGVKEGMKELRVWIDSQTDEEMLRGIREAKDMKAYENLGKSGIMRTIEDYAMGINFSRAMSVKYGSLLNRAAGTKQYVPIAIGRVMTCVLGMVVIREREIRNFSETPFYRVVGTFSEAAFLGEWKAVETSAYFESPLLYKENGFKKMEDAERLIADLSGKEAEVEEIEFATTKKRAPLLFNLAELQAECTKRYKISPDQTLEVAQSLYEKKMTTYPRTDARVLSSAVAKEISKNIRYLKGYEPTAAFVEKILAQRSYERIIKSSYTDDSKITDHYAIIPTGQLAALSSLTDLERSVFDMIVRRFLSIFYPPAEYETMKLTIGIGQERFFTSAKVLKNPGFLEISGRQSVKEDEEEEPKNQDAWLAFAKGLSEGDALSVQGLEVKEGKTKPPKRYTSGTMVLAMENAGQLIEDEELRAQMKGSGIGTSATRAEIIAKLVRIGYLNLNKKSQVLTPSRLGEMIFEVVNLTVPALLNPKMTASWEKGLDGITNGTVAFESYRAKLEEFIRNETQAIIDRDLKEPIQNRIADLVDLKEGANISHVKIGVSCPQCGAQMLTTPFGYGCEAYQKDGSGCNFAIGTIAGRTLALTEVKELLEKGKTGVLKGFSSKAGKKFEAALTLQKAEDGKVSVGFSFDEVEAKCLPNVTCPDCGGQMQILSYGYRCEHGDSRKGDPTCQFTVGTIAGKKLSTKQVTELLTNGKTELIEGFVSKNGKKFAAVLRLSKDVEGKHLVEFDFDDKEAYFIEDFFCPACHAPMVKTPFGFGCSTYDADNPESCRFSIGMICGKNLNLEQAKKLVKDGMTDTIRGFKSKSGKKFDACLKMERVEEGGFSISFDFDHVEAKKVKGVVCPRCGGDLVVTPFGFGCANYKRDAEDSCGFSVGKIAGVKIKEAQLKTLLTEGKTDVISGFTSRNGKKFDACLQLVDAEVRFFFPDEVKPVESTVSCPSCEKKLIRTKYYHECDCGFKVSHMVAQVDLSDEVMTELFTNGITTEKVTGFKSKSGNLFDAKLKYDKETGISFVFE
ncbi:DNA topoisomerase-3 [Lachnospiraceae bacterium XBB1006]|nr:DNA topoisomerase-3 [Lachnospiraceae bacterium XBB1006]